MAQRKQTLETSLDHTRLVILRALYSDFTSEPEDIALHNVYDAARQTLALRASMTLVERELKEFTRTRRVAQARFALRIASQALDRCGRYK